MQKGLTATQCPARIERVARKPTVILDTAHNVASIEALCDVLSESQHPRPAVLVFASTRGKDVRGMLHCLVQHFDHLLFTRYVSNPRAVTPTVLMRHAQQVAKEQRRSVEAVEIASPDPAWERAKDIAGSDGLICVTGSFFIAAEIGAHYRQSTQASE